MGVKTVKYNADLNSLTYSDVLVDIVIFDRTNSFSELSSKGGLQYTVIRTTNKTDGLEIEHLINANTGITVRFAVKKNGKYHSVGDTPAIIEYNGEDGAVSSESWYKDGLLWRAGDAPASVEYWPSEHGGRPVVMRETWYGDEGLMLSSDNYPAMRQYDARGVLVKELFTGGESGPRVENYR